MKYRLFSLFIICILVVVCVGFFTIHAQNVNKGIIVYPSNFDFTESTAPITEKIYLLNNNEQPVKIRVDIRNFTANGEEGQAILTTENTSFALASWITVSPTTSTIAPHKTETFLFSVRPPKNAEPGGHFGSIVFATVPDAKINGTAGASISEEVASLILLKVPGNTIEKGDIESFTTDKNFYEFGPVTFTARVKNIGDVHFAPIGQIVVRGIFGDTYYVQLQPRIVLPNSIRRIPALLPNTLLIGKYSATLLATYGSKNEQLHGYVEFYAFPFRYAAILFAALLGIFLMRHRLWRALKLLITGK